MKRASVLWIGAVVSLVLAACGGGADASSTTDATASTSTTVAGDAASVTESVVAALATDIGPESPFDSESAACVADGVIGAVGLERMIEVTAASADLGGGDPTAIFGQMTEDEIPLVMSVVEGCVDLDSAVPDTIALFGFTGDVAVCVGDSLVSGGFGMPILESLVIGTDPTALTGFDAAFLDALVRQCPDATRQLFIDDIMLYGVSTESATCVADAFVSGESFSDIVTVWMGIPDETVDSEAINNEMTEALIGCLTEDELATLGIETTTTTTATTTP